MKNTHFAILAKRLLPDFAGFSVKAPLMFISPVAPILRGVYFENHSYEEKFFYVWVFFLPLCVPTKHITFNFGKRIESPQGPWNADTPDLIPLLSAALKREALPLLSKIESLYDLVQEIRSSKIPGPHAREAIAFALARSGDVGSAILEIDGLTKLLDVKIRWQADMVERACALRLQLIDDATGARKQLEVWELESIFNLGLGKFQ